MPARKTMSKSKSQAAAAQVQPVETQAHLLRGRGDFQGTKHCWSVDLPETSPLHLRVSLIQRLGRSLKKGASSVGHSVRGIADEYLGLKPGDKIRSLNESETCDEMIAELKQAADQSVRLSISLERDVFDVLEASTAASSSSLRLTATPKSGALAHSMSESALSAAKLATEANGVQRSPLRKAAAPFRATIDLAVCSEKAFGSSISEASTRASTPCGTDEDTEEPSSPAAFPEPPLALTGQCWGLPGAIPASVPQTRRSSSCRPASGKRDASRPATRWSSK